MPRLLHTLLFPSLFKVLLRRPLILRWSQLFACLLLALPLVCARAADLGLILSDDGPANTEFVESLKTALAGSPWTLRKIVQDDRLASESAELQQVDLWISVGSAAFQAAAARPGPPLLATLISQRSYAQILEQHAGVRAKNAVSAIWLDQPLSRQLQLLRIVLPRQNHLGLITGPEGRAAMARVKSAAQSQGFEVSEESIDDELELVPALNRLFNRADVLLAIPDPLAFGRNSVRPVLLTSYRFQRPVIAFSSAFVTAGALAAVFSTPGQLARQTADFLLNHPGGSKSLPTPLYPRYFAVSVNRQVARSLALEIPENTVIQRKLETGRQDP